MTTHRISDSEQHLLLVVWRLGDEAYGLTIREELAKRTGRHLALGAIYTTLVRLEKKGLVRSTLSNPTPIRGGKAKRYFAILPQGVEALSQAKRVMGRLWDGLDTLDPAPSEPTTE